MRNKMVCDVDGKMEVDSDHALTKTSLTDRRTTTVVRLRPDSESRVGLPSRPSPPLLGTP
jgi:hypothetical protein